MPSSSRRAAASNTTAGTFFPLTERASIITFVRYNKRTGQGLSVAFDERLFAFVLSDEAA